MIFWDKILFDMIGVVGWKQSTLSGSVVVTDANKAASSGIYVQDAHPMVTVKNLKACQEDTAISDANMNVVLADLVKAGISNMLNFIVPQNEVFENDLLYKWESDFQTAITDKTGFVGFEMRVASRNDMVTVLNKIILQFNGSGSVKILLFNSGVKALVTSKTIAVTADTNITSALDWILGYITSPGGVYYIGFLTTGMTIYPYNRVYGYSNIMTPFNSIVFQPIYVADWTAETLFNINDIEYRTETFGMNFDITTCGDYSNIILQNKDRFAKAIQLATAVVAIEMMGSTSRINPEERVVINAMNQKTVVDSPQTANLYFSLESELKSLKKLFDGQRTIETGTLKS